jgi:hypothetical protein
MITAAGSLTARARTYGPRRDLAFNTVLLAAAATTMATTWLRLGDPSVRATLPDALLAIAAGLPTTLPAIVAVSAVAALDVLAGALVLRPLIGRPWPSRSDAVLGGFAGAVVLDAGLLFALAGFGLFRGPVLVVLLVAISALAAVLVRRSGPFVRHQRGLSAAGIPWAGVPLIALLWVGPILLALASPVVPFADVLPNHVAPAAHLLTFGGLASLTTDPSPIYGASRLFEGEIGLLGTLTVATGLDATLAMAASAVVIAVLSAIAAWRAASAAFGRQAGYWALVLFPLSFTFIRLPDARDSVTALPLAAFAFSLLARSTNQRALIRARPRQPDWLLGATLLAMVLVHPLVGALTWATVIVLAVADQRAAVRVLPAMAGAAIAALPQAAAMLDVGMPPIAGALALAAGAIVAVVAARAVPPSQARVVARGSGRPRGAIWVALPVVTAVLIGLGLVATGVVAHVAADLRLGFPVLFGLAAAAVFGLAPASRGGRRVALAAVGVGLAALASVAVVPGDSLTVQSIRYEVPKAIGYWLPWVCVPVAAGAVAAITRLRVPTGMRAAAVAGVLAVAVVPFGPVVPNTTQAEHPPADALSYDLHAADVGAWTGYPDARLVIDAAQREVVTEIRVLESSGTWRADDVVLHVAASIQAWRSIPVAAFTGAIEWLVAEDAQPTIFTTGPDLRPMSALATELARGPAYVLLEPSGLPSGIAAQIAQAGYQPVFANGVATLYSRR